MCYSKAVVSRDIAVAITQPIDNYDNDVACGVITKSFYNVLYKKPVQVPQYVVLDVVGNSVYCTTECIDYYATYAFRCDVFKFAEISTRPFDLRYPLNLPYGPITNTFQCNTSYLAPDAVDLTVEPSARRCAVRKSVPPNPPDKYYAYIFDRLTGFQCAAYFYPDTYHKFCLCFDESGRLNTNGGGGGGGRRRRRNILEMPSTPNRQAQGPDEEQKQQQFPMTFESLLGSVIASSKGVFNHSTVTLRKHIATNHQLGDEYRRSKAKEIAQADLATTYSGLCETVPSPNSKNNQICCHVRGSEDWVCLPGLLVIGAQKAGTTALFGYMLEHPEFRAGAARYPQKVEIEAEPVEKELHFFDSQHRVEQGPANYLYNFHTVHASQRSNYINADFTPSYILKWDTLQGIHELLPRSKIIIMLRDPVERAWSELKMKIRQDIATYEWQRLVLRNSENIKYCVEKASTGVKSEPDMTKQISKCVSTELAKHERWDRLLQTTILGYIRRQNKVKVKDPLSIQGQPLFHTAADGNVSMIGFGRGPSGGQRANYQSDFMNPTFVYDKLVDEIAQIERCLQNGDDTLKTCFTNEQWISSDISRGHVLRGMYYAQIKNVMHFFAEDQVMIVESEELRQHPEQVMKQVCKFAGLNDFKFELPGPEKLSARIDKHMPGFSTLSGWRLLGTVSANGESDSDRAGYHGMPENIRSLLTNFYAEHNELLFRFLGKRYEWT